MTKTPDLHAAYNMVEADELAKLRATLDALTTCNDALATLAEGPSMAGSDAARIIAQVRGTLSYLISSDLPVAIARRAPAQSVTPEA